MTKHDRILDMLTAMTSWETLALSGAIVLITLCLITAWEWWSRPR
jgi:hypothetical protein